MPDHYYLPPRDYSGSLLWLSTETRPEERVPAAALIAHWQDAPEWWRVWMLGLYAPDVASAVRALRVLCLAVDDCPTDRDDERTATQTAAIRAIERWLFGGPTPSAAAASAGPDRHAWEVAEVAAGRYPWTAYGSLLQTLLASAARFQLAIAPVIDPLYRRSATEPIYRQMVCRDICREVAEVLRDTHARDFALPDWPPSRLLDGEAPVTLPDHI